MLPVMATLLQNLAIALLVISMRRLQKFDCLPDLVVLTERPFYIRKITGHHPELGQ
jgi:hypothetical protein